MNLDSARQSFVSESRELIAEMELALLECEVSGGTPDILNAIFRTAHTIKGNAGLFGFDAVVSFTHAVESALDQARSGKITVDREFSGLLLESRDHMAALIDSIAGGGEGNDAQLQVWGGELITRISARCVLNAPEAQAAAEADLLQQAAACIRALLAQLSGGESDDVRTALGLLSRLGASEQSVAARALSKGPKAASEAWHVSVRFRPEILAQGLDPIPFVRYLASLGHVETVVLVQDALPAWEVYDPEASYLGYEIRLRSNESQSQLEDAFQFVRESATLTVLPPRAPLAAYALLLNGLPEGVDRATQLVTSCGSLTAAEAAQALGQGGKRDEAVGAPRGEVHSESEGRSNEIQSIRVEAPKLEHLINLVGELVIAGATTTLVAQRCNNAELNESTSRFGRLVEEVREQALKLRMVQMSATFARFQRLVRDATRELGKDIRLETSGGDTELDKTLIEKITDPLTHLVRNAIDHGIESTERRTAVGKNPIGTVRLHAYHDSGAVVIEVTDDGAGLDRERILAKARERGLVAADQALTDAEVYSLIFEPGFSTAAAVTNLSGRGVGMDVVKRNVLALRGSVDIESRANNGTTVRIRLPLTLAIIDGFLVRVASSAFVIPLEMVEECLDQQQVADLLASGRRYIDFRGQALPIICLRDYFRLGGAAGKRANVVIVRCAGFRAGLLVDELMGEHQTVIKPLSRLFRNVHGLGGSTIMGNGAVALILDIGGLIEQQRARAHKPNVTLEA